MMRNARDAILCEDKKMRILLRGINNSLIALNFKQD